MLWISFRTCIWALVFVLGGMWIYWWTAPMMAGIVLPAAAGADGEEYCGLTEHPPWSLEIRNWLAETVSPQPEATDRYIVIDTSKRQLTLYEHDKVLMQFPVAIGKPSTPSPIGEWKVVHKSANWGGGFGTRWLGLNVPWGIYGIHGTNKPHTIGTAASHGCFRMHNRNVEALFPEVPLGARVFIIGPDPAYRPKTKYQKPVSGQDVVILQKKIREAGFDLGYADGRYGSDTERAVRELEGFYGLSVDGVADEAVQYIVGFRRLKG